MLVFCRMSQILKIDLFKDKLKFSLVEHGVRVLVCSVVVCECRGGNFLAELKCSQSKQDIEDKYKGIFFRYLVTPNFIWFSLKSIFNRPINRFIIELIRNCLKLFQHLYPSFPFPIL